MNRLQGLGKTVEVIALICANKFQLERASCSPESVTQSPATLIITPPAILQQWKDEMRMLAPHLNVTTYHGMRIEASQNDEKALIRKCLRHDVVSKGLLPCLVSYQAVLIPLCYFLLDAESAFHLGLDHILHPCTRHTSLGSACQESTPCQKI